MTRFEYTGMKLSGERVSGDIKCQDRRHAVETLLGRGVHPVELESAVRGVTVATLWRALRNRVSTSELAVFTRQLAALVKAGMPVAQALGAVRGQTSSVRLKQVVGEVEDMLNREGVALASALEDHPRVFDPLYANLVRAGEESGSLTRVLRNLADHLSQASRLRRHVIGAFIYPTFLLVLGVAAVFILMVSVIPRFTELFDSFGQELPGVTQALIATSDFLAHWWPGVLIGSAAVLVGLVMVLRVATVRLHVDRFALACPVIGPLMLKIELARLARTLGEMLSGGVGILQALRVAGQSARNAALRASFGPMVEAVSAGNDVATAMNEFSHFPPMMIGLVKTGEATGQLPEMLAELSSIYEEEAERAVAAAVKLLEPILIVLMGGVIALIVAAIMLPIFQANTMVT